MRDLQTFLKQVCRVGLYVACGAARAENLLWEATCRNIISLSGQQRLLTDLRNLLPK